ncbi:MAG: hypothetical protein NVSMB17_17730 [Candidatus Dormibacteria bacterium]
MILVAWASRLRDALLTRRRLVLLAFLGVVAVLALVPELALARGGGGGGAHGGGGGGRSIGGGGGYSGGSRGGGGFFFFPLFFGGGGSLLCLIIVAVVAYLAYRSFTGGGGGAAEAYEPAYQPASQGYHPDISTQLAAIEAVDPNFNPQQFLDRAQVAFFLLQKAWQDRNVDEGRAYMSPGLYTGWRTQVEQMTAEHRKNVLEGLYIQGMNIVKATHDANFDTITVQVDASAKDYDIDDRTNKKLSGDSHDTPFTEFWTFTRSAGTRTLVSGGIIEKKCPNCGAPLDVNAVGECKYCNQAVTSGKFDWVLSRIDQANEFTG